MWLLLSRLFELCNILLQVHMLVPLHLQQNMLFCEESGSSGERWVVHCRKRSKPAHLVTTHTHAATMDVANYIIGEKDVLTAELVHPEELMSGLLSQVPHTATVFSLMYNSELPLANLTCALHLYHLALQHCSFPCCLSNAAVQCIEPTCSMTYNGIGLPTYTADCMLVGHG